MSVWHEPLLINILGHTAGALLFGIFLVLLYSGRGWSAADGRSLPGLAGGLSLVWNLGSLVVLAWAGLPPLVLALVVAVSFSVLSLLPAVLLHLALKESWPKLIAAGYVLSGIAVVMHFQEMQGNGKALHQQALVLITIGFLALTAAAVGRAVFRTGGGRPAGVRILASMCLALFASSFVHFGQGHSSQAWSSELLIHHAGIPLALFILLQDYRFILLDAFVRFLANALLAALLAGLAMALTFQLGPARRMLGEPLQEAFFLIGVALLLVLFGWLRNRVQGWLARAIFRQGPLANLALRIKDCPAFTSESQYVNWAGSLMADAAKAQEHAVVTQSEFEAAKNLHRPTLASLIPASELSRWNWAELIVPVRLGAGDATFILFGRRKGGQRYLGEDLESLARAASEVATLVDFLRQQEMKRLVNQAELRALQSQMNPHFLFNALNTLYGMIPKKAPGARRTVLNLAEIFRYFLRSDQTFVPLAKEMEIVRAYLEIEQLRLGERLQVYIQIQEDVLQVPIPVLSIQPLVENAIKHGVSRNAEPGYVRIYGQVLDEELRVVVQDSGSGAAPESTGAGVALQNVRRRLEICYGSGAELRLSAGLEQSTAELCIPRTAVPASYSAHV